MKLFSHLLTITILFLGVGSNLFGQQMAMQMPALALIGDDGIAVPIPASLGAYYEHLRAIARSGSRDIAEGIRIPGFDQSILRYFVLLLDHYKELNEKRIPEAEIIAHLRSWVKIIPKIHEYAVELMRLGRMWDLPDQLVGAIEWYVINDIAHTMGLAQFMREEEVESFLSPELSETHFTFEEQLHLLMQLDIDLQTTEPLQSVLLWLAWLSRDPELQTNPEARQTYILTLKKVSEFIVHNIWHVLSILPSLDQWLAHPAFSHLAVVLKKALLNSEKVQQILYTPVALEKRAMTLFTNSRDGVVLDQDHLAGLAEGGSTLQVVDLKTKAMWQMPLPFEGYYILLAQYPYIGIGGDEFIMIDAEQGKIIWKHNHLHTQIHQLVGGTLVAGRSYAHGYGNVQISYITVIRPDNGQIIQEISIPNADIRRYRKLNDHEIVINYFDYTNPGQPVGNSVIMNIFSGQMREIKVPAGYQRQGFGFTTKIVDQNHVAIQAFSNEKTELLIINTQTLAVEDKLVITQNAQVTCLGGPFVLIREGIGDFRLYDMRLKQAIFTTFFPVHLEALDNDHCLLGDRYLILFDRTALRAYDIKYDKLVFTTTIKSSNSLEKINDKSVFVISAEEGPNDLVISFPELGTISELLSFIKQILASTRDL